MPTQKLDRNRKYGTCYGMDDKGRKYYQDGLYFDGAGNAIDSDAGSKIAEPEASVTDDDGTVDVAAPAAPNKKVEDADKTDADQAAKLEQLNAMTVPQLKKVAKDLAESTGEEPERWTGKGIKEVLVEFIAFNTE